MKQRLGNIYRNQLFKDFSWRTLQTLTKQGVSFILLIILLKVLTPTEYGRYVYIMALVGFLVSFTDFGVSGAITKFVAEGINVQKLISTAIISIFCLTLIVISIYNITKEYFVSNQDSGNLILLAAPLLFLIPVTSVYDGVYRGLEKFKSSSILLILIGGINIISTYFLTSYYGISGSIVAVVLINIITIFLFGFYIFKLPLKLPSFKIAKELLQYSLWIGIASIGYFLYTRVDILVLGNYGFLEEISAYEVINKGFAVLVIPATVIGQVIAPKVTRLAASQDISSIKQKFFKYMRYSFGYGVLIGLLSLVCFPIITHFFFQEYLIEEFNKILILLIILLPFKVAGIVGTQGFFISTGKAHITAIITLIGGLINTLLDIVFISTYGVLGIFIVTLIVHSLSILVANIYFIQSLKLHE